MVLQRGCKSFGVLFRLILIPAFLACCFSSAFAQMQPNSQNGEFSAFDLIVGGGNYGAVYGYFGENWFEPSEPKDVIALLPPVQNADNFLPLFQGRIENLRTIRGVGTLRVDVSNFKLIVDVDKEEAVLATVNGIGELQGTENNLSLLHSTFIAGSAATDKLDLLRGMALTHNTILSKGSTSFQSTGTLADTNGYNLKNALVRKDFKSFGADMTAYGGLLETNGAMRFARSLDYMGVRLASNQNLLFRDEQLQGSNLEIFLPRRAQVQIFRESENSGNILYSRVLDFGTVQVDTRAFPQGSYNVEIVVKEGGTVLSRETRPFIKSQDLPPRGKPIMSFEAGEIRQDLTRKEIPVAAASYRARLLDWLGGGVGLAATEDDRVYELSLSTQKGLPLFGAMGLLQTSLTGAFADALQPAGIETTVSWQSPKAAASMIASKTYDRGADGGGIGGFALSDRQAVGFNFSAPVMLGSYRVFTGFNAEVSSSSQSGRKYRYGPTLGYTFEERGGYTPELKLEYGASESDDRVLATFSIRDASPVWKKTAEINASSIGEGRSLASYAALGYSGRDTQHDDWRKRLEASLGLRMEPLLDNQETSQSVLSSDVQYKGNFARTSFYLDQNLDLQTPGLLGGEVQSTLIWSPGAGIKATAQDAPSDMAFAMVTLRGNGEGLLDVTMNNIARVRARAGDTVVLPIPAYERVSIGIVDAEGKGGLKSKEKNQSVIGYPGNVAYREFTVMKSWVMMGSLMDSQSISLSGARFVLNGNIYYTDDSGFFTAEELAGLEDTLEMEGEDFFCKAKMPDLKEESAFIDFGDIACVKKPDPV